MKDKKAKKNSHEEHKEAAKKHLEEKTNLLDTLKRLQAEFENYRKRTDEQTSTRAKLASADLVTQIIPVLDNFELALKTECKDKSFAGGMKMVHDQLLAVLEAAGVIKINEVNIPFDPHLHEAVLQEESDKDANTVLEILQTGYKMYDRVLRHAKVKLAK